MKKVMVLGLIAVAVLIVSPVLFAADTEKPSGARHALCVVAARMRHYASGTAFGRQRGDVVVSTTQLERADWLK